MKKRKTVDAWELHVNYGYGQGFEHELTEYSYKEIRQRAKEYKTNCPQYALKIKYKREKLENVA